jgi:membrane protein DedA with SNARE-associated domain
VVWVFGYVALGYAFSESIIAISALLGDLTWFLAAGAVAIVLALRLRAAAHRALEKGSPDTPNI